MKYHLLEHVSFTEVDDEAVLLDLNTGTYFGLNHIGTHFLKIVKHSDSKDHIEQACLEIVDQYDVDQQKVRADLAELIDQLKHNSLLRESPK